MKETDKQGKNKLICASFLSTWISLTESVSKLLGALEEITMIAAIVISIHQDHRPTESGNEARPKASGTKQTAGGSTHVVHVTSQWVVFPRVVPFLLRLSNAQQSWGGTGLAYSGS